MGVKGATKKPFWAKARREYVCFNCAEPIAEGADVLIFQPISIHTWGLDRPADDKTPWDFACGECGEWEVPKPIHPNKGEIHSYGGNHVLHSGR